MKFQHSRLPGVLDVAGNSDAQSTHLCSECQQAIHGEISARNACPMREAPTRMNSLEMILRPQHHHRPVRDPMISVAKAHGIERDTDFRKTER